MKENTLLFLLLITFGSVTASLAQTVENDVVTTKDGRVLTGKIMRYTPGDTLKMESGTDETIELLDNEMLKVEQGMADLRDQKKEGEATNPIAKKHGIYALSMLSFAAGTTSEDGISLGAGISQVIGYQFKPHLGFGLGFGMDNYSRRGETVYPIFLQARGFLPSKKVYGGFYALAEGGYSLAFERENLAIVKAKGGPMGQFSLGYRSATVEGIDVNFDLGFKFQQAEFQRALNNGDIEVRKVNFQRLVFRVGIGLWKS